MIRASRELFDHPDGWYWDGHGGYRRFDYFTVRARVLAEILDGPVVILGCGFGYLVDELVKLGVDAHGVDASRWAIDQGREQMPHIGGRLRVADALTHTYMPGSAAVTEDMLPCLTNHEIQRGIEMWRGAYHPLIHILSTLDHGGTDHDPRLNWKTTAEWKGLLSPQDEILDVNGARL